MSTVLLILFIAWVGVLLLAGVLWVAIFVVAAWRGDGRKRET